MEKGEGERIYGREGRGKREEGGQKKKVRRREEKEEKEEEEGRERDSPMQDEMGFNKESEPLGPGGPKAG